jgi:hypothetical protein
MRELVKIPVLGRKSAIFVRYTTHLSRDIALGIPRIKRHALIRYASVNFRFECRELAYLSILLVHC